MSITMFGRVIPDDLMISYLREAQGDWTKAQERIRREIESQGARVQETAAAKPVHTFLFKVLGRELPDDVVRKIESNINRTVLEELGKLDNQGDLAATPLSEVSLGPEFAGSKYLCGGTFDWDAYAADHPGQDHPLASGG